MGVVVEYPIILHVDKVADILLSENILVSQQTKQIDVLHNFISEYIEDRTVTFSFSFRIKHGRFIYKEPK